MKRVITGILCCTLLMFIALDLKAQKKKGKATSSTTKSALADSVFAGIKLRNLGPGFMSGRIADIAIHPTDESTWYVAVGSGGVWKTSNAGVTFTPIFDKQTAYSIGCVTIDPLNPHIVWVGTGENVGGRHVGYGDGIYKSEDGGLSWKNMGLKESEHISKIIVHPENSNVVWVAVQGPLWNKGDERGLYKSTDGGSTWSKTLGNNEWTGVTDVLIDPRDPDLMYAATWDRHRTVAAYMGGGPGSGIHRSADGGQTWEKLSNGLPKSNMGKIGLAMSTQKPDIIYAAIELDKRTGGVYRSADKGITWEKRSDAVAGATGPHYYQELYASPHHFDRLYLVDNWMQYSVDGGKTFQRLNNKHKHGDNHAIAFKSSDPDYLLVGTDGGVYESFDLGAHWRFMENLPVTQYYKLAVDDAEPFYNIYGGTQDNSTQGGPSRTDNLHGIQNSDWKVVLNWDGHQPATEPGNPDIIYAERQEGNLSRVDLTTGEVIDIQPQPGEGEVGERFNWDAPILVSPHSPTRIYFASQRLWKSDNRGDSWTAISGDLTKNQNRIELPIMGRKQSWDNAWDFFAMSNFNTITSISESPQQQDLIYTGTDDGRVQVTENGGTNWRKIDVGSMPGIPTNAFVNDIKADLHDANKVYVCMDNHKEGDFAPYLMMSSDKGNTWQSMRGNLPDRTLIWRIVQDHEKPELFFLATEFGIYFTVNSGRHWTKLTGGVPTISFRDLAIQKRENDLVAASFGRGFFVLDDYSFLRDVSETQVQENATLFASRKAWWYIPRPQLSFDDEKGSQGASHFVAPNPEFGAIFTYHLKEGLKSKKEAREEKEKKLKNQNIPFDGYDQLAGEKVEIGPKIWLTVKDDQGKVIRRIEGPVTAGFHRVAWDLRYPAPQALKFEEKPNPNQEEPKGFLAPPGSYTVSMTKQVDGITTSLSEPVTFDVVPLRDGALPGASKEAVSAFYREFESVTSRLSALNMNLGLMKKQVKVMHKAIARSQVEPGEMDDQLHALNTGINEMDNQLNGNLAKRQVGEKTMPTLGERSFAIYRGLSNSTYGPTETHKQTMAIIQKELGAIEDQFSKMKEDYDKLSNLLIKGGAPYVGVE